ncbi:hypothetical protein, partial [Enterococcus casseliflavus]|uniref:hypothetical protein n=1 Tax=Enterococcus casseliflavus TaxID=37734 RepID=UPI003D09C488
VQRIYPAHGPVLEPARPVIEGYIAHRLEREAQIVAALAAGAETVPDVVARVYREVAAALHPVARLSVLSHLVKLEREGRAALRAEDVAERDLSVERRLDLRHVGTE